MIKLETDRKPAVGDRVHFVVPTTVDGTGCCVSADITALGDDCVGLRITMPDGEQRIRSLSTGGAQFDGGPDVDAPEEELLNVEWSCDGWNHEPLTWHWIGREL